MTPWRIIKIFLLMNFLLTGCVFIKLPVAGPLAEKVIGGQGRAKIAVIDISGVIKSGDHRKVLSLKKGPGIVARIKEELDLASKDPDVKALILRINSPGGSVTPSDIINHEIKAFKKDKKIPVVAHLMDTAASGAYYIAVASDVIVAQPTTVTGSIGVISFNIKATGLMEKIGIENRTLKSGPKKDMGSSLREMTGEERKILQSIIDELYGRFLDVVVEGRKAFKGREDLKTIADGRVYTAKQALKLNLIDSIGYMDDAIEEAKKLAGVEEARIITYAPTGSYKNNMYSMGGMAVPEINLVNIDAGPLAGMPGIQFMYLWMP
ncbi:MAG: signal peptide peptidase SppA [Thermodesulfobacteriota bacterium]|nr:MAG: signal peptide peptidase SppA [Thermodesulfobacteriota bacterium]